MQFRLPVAHENSPLEATGGLPLGQDWHRIDTSPDLVARGLPPWAWQIVFGLSNFVGYLTFLGYLIMKRLVVLIFASGMAFAQAPSPSASMAVIGPSRDVAGTAAPSDTDRILAELLPQARGQSTLIGGTVQNLDNIRDRMVIRAFGGRDIGVLFDGRTQFYRDGIASSLRDLRTGQRVYVDTALAGNTIFARSVRVVTQSATGQSNGQVLSYDAGTRELSLRDVLAGEPARFLLAPNAVVLRDGKTAAATDLHEGALVALKFSPSLQGPGVAREVSILATPGGAFLFSGKVSHLDLHSGLLVLLDSRDQKSYDIHFNPEAPGIDDNLREGAEVVVTTNFDGTGYTAKNISVKTAPEN